jgi:hypothetical protein
MDHNDTGHSEMPHRLARANCCQALVGDFAPAPAALGLVQSVVRDFDTKLRLVFLPLKSREQT